jgi:hypothetical protein
LLEVEEEDKVLLSITVLTAEAAVEVFCILLELRYRQTVTESRWVVVALQEQMAITLFLILKQQLEGEEEQTTEGLLLE